MISLPNFLFGGRSHRSLLTAATVVVAASSVIAQNTLTVRGTVTDSKNEALIGVSVRVKGTTHGAATDMDGKFTLAGVPRNAVLEFSYVGMQPQSVLVNGQTQFNIVLKDNASQLTDVVVVGYGRQKRVNLTGAVSSVDSKQLAARPVQNVGQALQGMVPGLNFSVGNGGGGLENKMSFNVRGAGTIGNSSSSPLVLIDGVEGDMTTLAPTDIESISVLKDASASSIYGSRAAFGVILITTKGGKEGKTRINYNGNVRFSTATQVPEMMDSEMFANYFNRAAANSGNAAVFNETTLQRIKAFKNGTIEDQYKYGTELHTTDGGRVDPEIWRKYQSGWANTEWFGYFYDKNVPSQEHNLSLSGGSKTMNYYLSGGIMSQKGLLKVAEDRHNRFNLTAKINAQITKWLDVNYTLRWTREDYKRPTYLSPLFFHNIIRRWPTNATMDPNGFIMPHNEALQLIDGGKTTREDDYTSQQLTFIAHPIKGLTLRAENNYNTTTYGTHEEIFPVYWHDQDKRAIPAKWDDWKKEGLSQVSEQTQKVNYFNGRYFGEYAHEWGKHDFKVVAGLDLELRKYSNLYGEKKDLITTEVPTLNTATNDRPALRGGANHWSTMGLFARVNYVYDSRYLAEVSVRRDGSSRFIGDKTWATFPSFSLGWNISNEQFWGKLKNTISLFKIRGSWGALGNTNTNALYPWFQSLPVTVASTTSGGEWLLGGNRQTISNAPGIVSSALTWERVQSWNLGLDFALLRNRLQGSFDYFVRDTKDVVGPAAPLTSLLGTAQPATNNTELQSKGWELELRWRDQIKDFHYGAKLVLSDNIVTVTKYYNPTGTLSSGWYSGKREGEIWGYRTRGIAQSDEEMNQHLALVDQKALGNNWTAGDIMYEDTNGDKKISNGNNTLKDHGDLSIIGYNVPRYHYSFTFDASWRGIDFSVMLQGVGKRDFFTSATYFSGATHGQWHSAAFVEHWDFWRPEGDPLGANTGAYYPRVAFNSSGKNFQTQTRYLQDASYMRIKNMQLGYTLPKSLTSKFGVSSLRVYASVDNLATFTKLSKIFDPEGLGGEWGVGKVYPLQRTWSLGLNLGI